LHASTISERIVQIRDRLTQAEFAERVGINANTLRAYEKGRTQPSAETLSAICVKFNVSAHWLLTGEGPMFKNDDSSISSMERSEVARRLLATRQATSLDVEHDGIIECADCQIMMMPMVEARLSAGTGSFETGANIERRYAFRMDFLMRKGRPSQMVLMRVAGDSMEPEVKHNDVVLIDQSQLTPRPGALYAVGVEDMVYLKLINATPGKLVMTSYNAAYPPLEVDARGDLANGIRIIGRAVWVGRELS